MGFVTDPFAVGTAFVPGFGNGAASGATPPARANPPVGDDARDGRPQLAIVDADADRDGADVVKHRPAKDTPDRAA